MKISINTCYITLNFILKRNKSSNFHTLCCKKKFFLSCSKTHFENRRSYRYYKQYCSSRAENWSHISTQKPPNVGSSFAISEPIIAGLVLVTGSPNSMKLGNLVQRLGRCSALSGSFGIDKLCLPLFYTLGPLYWVGSKVSTPPKFYFTALSNLNTAHIEVAGMIGLISKLQS